MISTMGLFFVMRGADHLSRHIRAAAGEMRHLAKNSDELKAKFAQLDAAQKRFTSHMARATAWAMGTFALVSGIRGVSKAFAGFEEQMKRLELTMGGQGASASAHRLGEEFRSMAGKVEYSATALAKAGKSLAQLGFSVDEVSKSIPVVADLMTVGEISAQQATDLMAQVLRGFGIGVDELRTTMDKLTVLGYKTPASLKFLSDGMKYAMRASGPFNLSLEQTLAFVGLLSPLMMKAGATSRTFAQFMSRIAAPPSKGVKKEFSELFDVWSAYDQQTKKLKDPMQILAELMDLTRGWDPEKRNAFFKRYLGMRAQVVAGMEKGIAATDKEGNLVKGLIAAYKATTEHLKTSKGLLKDNAGELRKGYSKTVDRLSASWESVKISIGKSTGQGLQPFLETLNTILQKMLELDKASGGMVGKATGYGMLGMTGLAGAAMAKNLIGLGVQYRQMTALIQLMQAQQAILTGTTSAGTAAVAANNTTQLVKNTSKIGAVARALGIGGALAIAAYGIWGVLKGYFAEQKAKEKAEYEKKYKARAGIAGLSLTAAEQDYWNKGYFKMMKGTPMEAMAFHMIEQAQAGVSGEYRWSGDQQELSALGAKLVGEMFANVPEVVKKAQKWGATEDMMREWAKNFIRTATYGVAPEMETEYQGAYSQVYDLATTFWRKHYLKAAYNAAEDSLKYSTRAVAERQKVVNKITGDRSSMTKMVEEFDTTLDRRLGKMGIENWYGKIAASAMLGPLMVHEAFAKGDVLGAITSDIMNYLKVYKAEREIGVIRERQGEISNKTMIKAVKEAGPLPGVKGAGVGDPFMGAVIKSIEDKNSAFVKRLEHMQAIAEIQNLPITVWINAEGPFEGKGEMSSMSSEPE